MVFRKLRNLVARQAQAAASKETANTQPLSDDEQPEPFLARSPRSSPTSTEVPVTVVTNKGHKDKIKFEDWKCFEHYLEGKEGNLFKFDLKNGYHHIDIFEPHQKFLGFSWVFKGNIKFFVSTVLPFGLTSAPFIFTKVVRPLVKYWRFNSVKITCFSDDGIGIEYNYEEARRKSEFVQDQVLYTTFKNLHGNHAKFLPG